MSGAVRLSSAYPSLPNLQRLLPPDLLDRVFQGLEVDVLGRSEPPTCPVGEFNLRHLAMSAEVEEALQQERLTSSAMSFCIAANVLAQYSLII